MHIQGAKSPNKPARLVGCRDCSAALCSTLQLYRSAVDAVGADALRSLPAAEADAAIRDVLSKARKLHPAFNRPDGQYRACKRLSEAVLAHLLPSEDRSCPMMRVMLRELFAACLLRSTLASLAPYSINKVLAPAALAAVIRLCTHGEFITHAARQVGLELTTAHGLTGFGLCADVAQRHGCWCKPEASQQGAPQRSG